MWIMPPCIWYIDATQKYTFEKFIQINKQKNTEDKNPTCKEIPKTIFQLYILLNTIILKCIL